MAVDVGQPALDAVVVEGQPLVIEAEQVQDRGVEVVDRRDVLDGLVAELVGRAVAERRASRPAPASQTVKPFGLWSRPLRPLLERRHPAELGHPDDQRVVEQAARASGRVSRAAAGWSRIGPWTVVLRLERAGGRPSCRRPRPSRRRR